MVVAGANVHDTKLLRQTLENIVVARPDGPGKSQRTCAWIRDMTTPRAEPLQRTVDTGRTSGVSARRSWMAKE